MVFRQRKDSMNGAAFLRLALSPSFAVADADTPGERVVLALPE